ncbi:threonylcarbamoyl-AMP synthase [bacterium]|nr:threonylcarbamoyl-AMP synthase [bacterium]
MRRVRCDPARPDAAVLAEALAVLSKSGLVVAPTDTVYGLLAHPDHPKAIDRIYTLKKRPHDKPLPYLVDSMARLAQLEVEPNREQRDYLSQHWPGATTVLLTGKDGVKLGLRMPDCPLILELIAELGRPLASTSANPSGKPDTNSAGRLAGELLDGVDLLLDAGRWGSGRASTVVDLTTSPFAFLR